MAPILSACLVMYRCRDEIDVALRCIQNADLEVSVFLVDNSPEEMTAERLKWAFPGVVVLPQERNVGLTRAHNAVLDHLSGKYHLILDPGVSFNPHLLRRMVSYMEAHPNIAVLTPRFFSEDGTEFFFPRRQLSVRYLLGSMFSSLGGIFRRWQREYTLADQEVEMPAPVESAPITCMLVRTEVFRQLGGFDPHFTRTQEDADLCRRILDARLGSIVYHPDLRVLYRPSGNPANLFANRTHHFSAVLRYFMKWGISW